MVRLSSRQECPLHFTRAASRGRRFATPPGRPRHRMRAHPLTFPFCPGRRVPMTRWLLGLLAAGLFAATSGRADEVKPPEGFKALFNGTDLKGWRANEGGKLDVWGADKGLLVV